MSNGTVDYSKQRNTTINTKAPLNESTGIEVGIIIMGLSCVCVVACALVILQVRSASLQRRRRRRQQQAATINTPAARIAHDPLEATAPPSYDAVMRCPQLYPPSPRSSISSISNIQRTSATSNLSLFGNRRIAPENGTEDGFNASVRDPTDLGPKTEDQEEPPPPYPGATTAVYLEIENASSNVHYVNAWLENRGNYLRINQGERPHENSCYSNQGNGSRRSSYHSDQSRRSSSQGRGSFSSNCYGNVGSNSRRNSGCQSGIQISSNQGDGSHRNETNQRNNNRSRANSFHANRDDVRNGQEINVSYSYHDNERHSSNSNRHGNNSSSNSSRLSSSESRCHGNSLGDELLLIGGISSSSRCSSLSNASEATLLHPCVAWDEGFPRELTFTSCGSRPRQGRRGNKSSTSSTCRCHCHKNE